MTHQVADPPPVKPSGEGSAAPTLRYGDFVRAVAVDRRSFRYADVFAAPRTADTDRSSAKVELRPTDVYRLLRPYVSSRFIEQLRAVVPLALYLALFQLLILRAGIADSWTITGGLVAVIVGLMLFLEGLKRGLMPFGETIGGTLPRKSSLPVVLGIALLLGVGVTFAEPAIGALKTAGSTVSAEDAPYLYALLTEWTDVLVLVVGAGVGLAAVLGTLRFLYGWSLKPLIYASLVPALGLTLWLSRDAELAKILGLAWDCGAVTTGPVTVPLVLALGIGVASAAGKGDSALSGFGIVTLASLFPILAVMGLGLWVAATTSPQEIVAAAALAGGSESVATGWWQRTPGREVVLGLRAIVPLVLFLLLVMKLVLRERIRNVGTIVYGISLALVGMIVFSLGLVYGLAALGGQSGGLVPAAFLSLDAVAGSPLYPYALGVAIALLFAFLLGFGATLAEPALQALGVTVEKLTDGAFRRSMLIGAVAFGVGLGIGLGIVKILFDLPIAWLLVPGYGLALVLTPLSSEEFVNVAWDSAGVTTGPVTVPLVLAMGLGFGGALRLVDGFGILAMASICPILSVLIVGLWSRWAANRRPQAADVTAPVEMEEIVL